METNAVKTESEVRRVSLLVTLLRGAWGVGLAGIEPCDASTPEPHRLLLLSV